MTFFIRQEGGLLAERMRGEVPTQSVETFERMGVNEHLFSRREAGNFAKSAR